MKKLKLKLALVVLGVALFASVGLSIQVPAYGVSNFNTYMTNCYSWAGWARYAPFYRSWGTVSGMPTFMIESVRTRNLFTAETVKFDRVIACPFICASAASMTATVKLFRDYDNGTPLNYSGSDDFAGVDSLWIDYPGYLQSVVITYAAADTPAYFLIGGFALPNPRQ